VSWTATSFAACGSAQSPRFTANESAGFHVAYDVAVNTFGWTAQNQAGMNSATDNGANPSDAQTTITAAGIEVSDVDMRCSAFRYSDDTQSNRGN
jgi:hypothetical protein